MAELDYAFLADFATIQDSKLTTVGASFTRIGVPSFPSPVSFAVAGRVRCGQDDADRVALTMRVRTPGDEGLTYEVQSEIDASRIDHPTYDGVHRGIVFAMQINIPLLTAGLYSVDVDLDDTDSVDRTLKFEAAPLAPAE